MAFESKKITSAIYQIWRWWIDELLGLTPAAWRDEGGQDKPACRLFVEEAAIFSKDAQGVKRPVAEIVRETKEIRISAWPDGEDIVALNRGQVATIELSPSYCLSRKFSMPLMAEEEVKGAVELSLSRNFPIPPEHLSYAFYSTNDKVDGKTNIITAVVRRNFIEEILSFVRSIGLLPASVVFCEENDIYLEFRRDLVAKLRGKKRRFYVALSLLPFVIFTVAAIVLMLRIDTSISRVESELQPARDEAAAFSIKRDRLRDITARAEFLESVLLFPSLSETLNELSHLIPDGTWVREFRLQNNRVVLMGETPDLALVMPALESSKLFESIKLVSLNQSATGELDNFEIELTLKAGKDDK